MMRHDGKRQLLWALSALVLASASSVRADDWPQWLGPQRDGVWREKGILDKFPPTGPKVRWRADVGLGYAGPAVAKGRVYLTDLVLAEGSRIPQNLFATGPLKGKERIRCFEEATGKEVWTHSYDVTYEISYPYGPRTTPAIANGKLYAVGAMGNLYCLEAETGKPVWNVNFQKQYEANPPFWGHSASPLVDGERVICLVGRKPTVAAFDANTGKELWTALTINGAEVGYCPPILIEAANTRQLIIWDPTAISSLDPATGKVYWSEKYPAIRSNMTIPTPRKEGDLLFVTSFYGGSMMFRLDADKPGVSTVWKKKGRSEQPAQTEALHAVMTTPIFKNGHIYGIDSYGELRCLKASTGERVWTDLQATGSKQGQNDRWNHAFIIEQGDRYFLFTEKGDLVIAKMSPKGYEEISRANVLPPTSRAGFGGSYRNVLWSHPAFANRSMFARNDRELICVSLAADE